MQTSLSREGRSVGERGHRAVGVTETLSSGAGLASVHVSDDTFMGALLWRRQDGVPTCSVDLAEPRPHHAS